MFEGLDRDDLIEGLKEVIRRSGDRETGRVDIRIIGGAALQLAYFARPTTVDIDARVDPFEVLAPIIEEVARDRGWPVKWLNNEAQRAGFIPTWGRQVEWSTLFDDGRISISVASVEALLAMKLRAFERRGRRDLGDVLQLLALAGLASPEVVEEVVEQYFPGEALEQRTADFLGEVYAGGLPIASERPELPRF